jgi:ribosome-binding factor A
MESTRQSKISRLIQKELGELFIHQTKLIPGVLLSISSVRVSPDLSVAKVYLSIFPSERGPELLEGIKMNAKEIRYDLGQRMRHQLRIIPELIFYIDDSLDYIQNIDELLKK